MDVSLQEAKDQLPQLVQAARDGQIVTLTHEGEPVAQLTPVPQRKRMVQFDGLKDRVKVYPGWDDPVDLDSFLRGEC